MDQLKNVNNLKYLAALYIKSAQIINLVVRWKRKIMLPAKKT